MSSSVYGQHQSVTTGASSFPLTTWPWSPFRFFSGTSGSRGGGAGPRLGCAEEGLGQEGLSPRSRQPWPVSHGSWEWPFLGATVCAGGGTVAAPRGPCSERWGLWTLTPAALSGGM